MLRIAICDDEETITSYLEKMILDYYAVRNMKAEIDVFNSGESLLDFTISEHGFDLIFLDIELKELNGVAVGKKIRKDLDDYVSKIVYISSKTGYELELFNVQPLNFLQKPIAPNRVYECIDLAEKLTLNEGKVFEYSVGGNTRKVQLSEILYFEAKNRQVAIVTTAGTDTFYGKISKIKEELPYTFCLCHQSYIINFDKVAEFSRRKVIMSGGAELPVSRTYEINIQKLLMTQETEKLHDPL